MKTFSNQESFQKKRPRRKKKILSWSEKDIFDLFNNIKELVVFHDRHMRVLWANRVAGETVGLDPVSMIGRFCYEIWPQQSQPCPGCPVVKALETGQSQEGEITTPDGRVWVIRGYPIRNAHGQIEKVYEIGLEITKQKRAEADLQARLRQQAAVAELGQLALAGEDLNLFMDKAVAFVAQALEVEYVKILELMPDQKSLLLRAGVGWKEGLVGRATVGAGLDSQAGYTLASDQPVIVADLRSETRFHGPALLFDHGIVSGLSVIIYCHHQPFGVFGAHTSQSRVFNEHDISFLEMVANLVATAICRQKTQQTLQESEERWHSLVEHAPDIILTVTLDGTINFINHTIAGLEVPKVVGTKIYDYLPPKTHQMVRSCLERVWQTGQTENYENEGAGPHGQTSWYLTTVGPQKQHGQVVALTLIIKDITDRKSAENELRRSYELYHTLASNFPNGIVAIFDHDLRYQLVEGTYYPDFYLSKEKMLGKIIFELFSEEFCQVIEPDYRATLAGQTVIKKIPFQGHIFQSYSLPIKDEQGRVVAGMRMVQDITEQSRLEETLHYKLKELSSINQLSQRVSSGLLLEEVTEAALDSICEYLHPDLSLLYLRENENLILQGAKKGEVQFEIEKVKNLQLGQCLCGLAVSQGLPIYSLNIHQDERCTLNECKAAGLHSFAALPLFGKHEIIGVLSLASLKEHDFSKQGPFLETLSHQVALGLQNALLYKQLKEESQKLETRVEERTHELKEAALHLQEADRMKSVFLASMSHELRTPLNSIIGFTGLLLMGMSGELNEVQKKQLSIVKSSSNHLLNLINDVLDIAKIEAGKVELKPEEFEFSKIVQEVLEGFEPAIKGKGLNLQVDIPEGIRVLTDRRRIKQILLNLISNAVKFTEQGYVRVAAKVLDDHSLELRVIDSGLGIREEDMARLFEPFQRIDILIKKEIEGTGLGLYLTKKVIELMGGTISAKSQLGRGSEFVVALPGFQVGGK